MLTKRAGLCALVLVLVAVRYAEPRELQRRNVLSSKIGQRRMGDIEFMQQVFNRTLEGDMEQAFSMLIAKVSDDLSTTMSKITDFLEGFKRNITMGTKKDDQVSEAREFLLA